MGDIAVIAFFIQKRTLQAVKVQRSYWEDTMTIRSTFKVRSDFSENYHVTWGEFHQDALRLAKYLAERHPGKFKRMVVVTRGGMGLGLILARELDIRNIETIGVSAYQDFKTERTAKITKKPSHQFLGNDSKEVLVVEDLVDTGITIELLRDMMPHATFVAIYAKPKGRKQLDYYVRDVPQDTWIHQPWDLEPTRRVPLVGSDS
jgi:xanthine phosphoribosyltransferase